MPINETMHPETARLMDAMELAWGVIANAHGGNWDEAAAEWRAAAERWRDEHWHPALDRNGYSPRESVSPRRFRWNPAAAVWEFYEDAWGGWCVLRQDGHDTSAPMSYEDGAAHIEAARARHDRGDGPPAAVVLYRDTEAETCRAPGASGG